jgi:hypothetical protein
MSFLAEHSNIQNTHNHAQAESFKIHQLIHIDDYLGHLIHA